MPRSSVQIDLEEQFQSIKHAIWAMYPTGSKVGVIEQRSGTLLRPSWRVSYLTHRDEQVMARVYAQVVDWTIDYYGMNRADVMDKLGTFERVLKHGGSTYRLVNLLPAIRFDWQFPQVFVDPVTDVAGTLPEGTYHIRVSGIDLCDEESAASVTQDVVVGAGQNAIQVRVPRVPYSRPFFKGHNVYVNDHLEVELRQFGPFYPQVVIKDLLTTGPAPTNPSDTVRVAWKFLRVTGFAASSREDDIKNGVFTGNISLQTTVNQEHDFVQKPYIEEVNVATTMPDGAFTITVGA